MAMTDKVVLRTTFATLNADRHMMLYADPLRHCHMVRPREECPCNRKIWCEDEEVTKEASDSIQSIGTSVPLTTSHRGD